MLHGDPFANPLTGSTLKWSRKLIMAAHYPSDIAIGAQRVL